MPHVSGHSPHGGSVYNPVILFLKKRKKIKVMQGLVATILVIKIIKIINFNKI
jgi:hypothetical protein